MILQNLLIEAFINYSDKDAIISDMYSVNYAELFQKTAIIKTFLINTYGKGNIIPLIFSSSEYYIYGMIGALFSENIFLPLDSIYPFGKIIEYIRTAESKILLSDRQLDTAILNNLSEEVEVIFIEDILLNCSSKTSYINYQANENDVIYLYYTSGSTGIPKGILGKNESLCHFIIWEIMEFNVTENDIFAQLTSPAFDPYLRDVFVPLCAGAKIRLVNRKTVLSSRIFNQFIYANKITFLHTTPSLLAILVKLLYKPDYFERLRYILIAGEILPPQLVIKWYRHYTSDTQLVNLYGPAETTLAKVFMPVPRDFSGEIVPVGRPIPDVNIEIVNGVRNGEGNDREIGEICIETKYLSHGYLDQKFENLRYLTGDIGYVENDQLYIIGRKDEQIKIGGVRINLNEIANRIIAYDARKIEACTVIYSENKLHAFYVSKITFETRNVREKLQEFLLPIHIPHYFYRVDVLPITPNGKIDKRALLSANYLVYKPILSDT